MLRRSDLNLSRDNVPNEVLIGIRTFYANGDPAETFSFTLKEGRGFLTGNERRSCITISAEICNGRHWMKRKIYVEDLKRAISHGEQALELATKGKSAESAVQFRRCV